MSTTPIPFEAVPEGKKKKKSFRPKLRKEERDRDDRFLKNICLRIADFINAKGRSSVQQIDDLIMGLQRSVLTLQRKKRILLDAQTKNNSGAGRSKKKKMSWFGFGL